MKIQYGLEKSQYYSTNFSNEILLLTRWVQLLKILVRFGCYSQCLGLRK